MNSLYKVLTVGAVVLAAIALVLGLSNSGAVNSTANLAGSSLGHQETIPWGFGTGIQVGPASGMPLIRAIAVGTCNLAEANTPGSMGATTTMTFNCPVGNGVSIAANDLVQVSLKNGHAAAFGAFDVVDSVASSTATGQNGIITVTLLNNVGAATSSFPLATTSAQFEINRL